jgi:hypothetical protein
MIGGAPLDPRSQECSEVLRRYTRAIVHMREEFKNHRLGLVFGAGIGKPFGFPKWEELLGRIAASAEVQGESIMNREPNVTAQAQQLYQKYKQQKLVELRQGNVRNDLADSMKLRAGWRKIVHDCLYSGVPPSIEEILKRDDYLVSFLPIIRKSRLTVTYNFDDLLERLLAHVRNEEEKKEKRGYTTVWSGNVQLQGKTGVVYHPNGFLPRTLREKPSDDLVFLEDTFADQLIDSIAGYYASLTAHMAQTTCLFIGLSMGDPTLKHLLRQTARAFPGHCHYRIAHTPTTNADVQHEALEAAASFNVYNLNTLHLKPKQYCAVATLLPMLDDDFLLLAEETGVPPCYRFMVTGPVGVGKSTLVSHLRNLLTQDEWMEERAPGMEKSPDLLSLEEQRRIDEWVADQISLKNLSLMKARTGLHLTDRAPLDAFAFTPLMEWRQKAELIRSRISTGEAKSRKLLGAHIILLTGDPEVMAARAISLHKVTTSEKLSRQQDLLKKVYEPLAPGVTILDTTHKTIAEVVKQAAELIFQRDYREGDLDGRLNAIRDKGYET